MTYTLANLSHTSVGSQYIGLIWKCWIDRSKGDRRARNENALYRSSLYLPREAIWILLYFFYPSTRVHVMESILLLATPARSWNPNPKHPMATLALFSRDMPNCILQKHYASVRAERPLLGIHLLRSIVRRLLLPRPLGRQFVRVIVRPLLRLVGLEGQFRRFTVEPLL